MRNRQGETTVVDVRRTCVPLSAAGFVADVAWCLGFRSSTISTEEIDPVPGRFACGPVVRLSREFGARARLDTQDRSAWLVAGR